MADPSAATIQDITWRGDLQPGYPFEEIPEGVIEVDVVRGMVPSLVRREQPQEALIEAKNARVEVDGIRRRDGTTEYATKPDSNRIVDIFTYIDESASPHVVRISTEGIHVDTGEGSFRAYTDNVGLAGNYARLDRAIFLGDIYVSGLGDIFKIDISAETVDPVTEAPPARFITNWADRVIAGYVDGDNFKLAWSANADPEDWTSISAGETNLVQAPSDLGDSITGLFGFEQEMVILRRNTIWHVSRQPFATAPFRFRVAVAGHGSDLPYTAVQVPGGLIYADYKTRAVYVYQPGQLPRSISDPIEEELFSDFQSMYWAQATFDPLRMEYVLGLVTQTDGTLMEKFWIFNLRRGSWTYDEGPACSALGSIVFYQPTFIDDLTGDIDDLSTTIDQLGDELQAVQIFKGTDTGEIIYHDPSADTDYDTTAFEMVLESINFGSLSRRRTMRDLMLFTSNTRGGNVLLSHSKDASTWTNEKTVTLTAGDDEKVRLAQQITGDDLFWRLRASASDVKVRRYWSRVREKGMTRT